MNNRTGQEEKNCYGKLQREYFHLICVRFVFHSSALLHESFSSNNNRYNIDNIGNLSANNLSGSKYYSVIPWHAVTLLLIIRHFEKLKYGILLS